MITRGAFGFVAIVGFRPVQRARARDYLRPRLLRGVAART